MVRTNDLQTKPIGKLLVSLAVPAIIAQLVNLLYNMVDRMYLGRMDNGTLAMAGLSIAVPLITLINAFTALVGSGGAPLVAIKLGEKDKDGAEKIMTQSFVSLLISGLLITTIVLLFQDKLLVMFGARHDTLEVAKEYMGIYVLGTVFVQITMGMNAYINAQGYTKIGMSTIVIGAIMNIILDPIFIFTFKMGVAGAALATIISQAVSAAWVLYFLFGQQSTIKIRKEYFKPDFKIIAATLALGISPFVMSGTESLLQISFNNQLVLYGGTLAVSSMGILMTCNTFVFLPIVGICQGAQPIISYNYGAKEFERVKQAIRYTVLSCFATSVVLAMTIMFFAPLFTSIFSKDPDLIRLTSWGMRIFLIGGLFFGAQIACQQTFMALGQAKKSLFLALFRKVFVLIPLIYVLPMMIGSSSMALNASNNVSDLLLQAPMVFAVILAEPVSDMIATSVTVSIFIKFYKSHLKVSS